MIQKKVCMLGAFAVGKTSLVRRFAYSIFSEKYHTTVGVTVDKATVRVEGQEVVLLLWDLAGEDEYGRLRESYLRGASGYVLVADGTRPATLETALNLQHRAAQALGDAPFVLALNKNDLTGEWVLDEARIRELTDLGWTVVRTSAKNGHAVEELFEELARRMWKPR